MFGFLVGTACLVGLIKTVRHGGGCGYGGGGRWGHHGHHGHHGGWSRGGGRWGGGRSWMLRRVFERLDTTPGQEKVILAAMEEIEKSTHKLWEEKDKSRADVARAMKGEHFDQTVVREMFTRHSAALEEIQKTISAELAKVHEALDEKQRAAVSELLEHGGWGGRGRGGGRWGGGRWGGRGGDYQGQYV